MSYSICIRSPKITPESFERFCLMRGLLFKEKTAATFVYEWRGAEIVLHTKNLNIFVTVPWRSKKWTDLWHPASIILKQFGGTVHGDGIAGIVSSIPSLDEWTERFKLDTGEK